jgi:glutamyl-tRNA reductase
MVGIPCPTYASGVSTSHRIYPHGTAPENGAGPHPHHPAGPHAGSDPHAAQAGATGGCPVPHPAAHEEPELASLRLLSVSHRTASFAELERCTLDSDTAVALRRTLAAEGIEALVLDTCNRTELYWRARSDADDGFAEAAFAAAVHAPLDPSIVARSDGEAVARHLFRVACGLESLVIGEAEIMGQVRCALAGLEMHGPADGFLHGLVQGALRCGGLARSETAIGAGAMSVASGAVQALARRMGGLDGRTVAVIGAGEVGVKAARQFAAAGAVRVMVLNRTLERARFVAAKVRGEAHPLEALDARLAEADAVLTATRAPLPLLDAHRVRAALARRATQPLFLADVSMPRAITHDVAAVAGVTMIDLAGLEDVVAENRERRAREVPLVEAVIERELAVLRRRARDHMIRPILAALRRQAEVVRRAEIARAAAEGALDAAAVERITKRLVDRLLAAPALALRRSETPVDPQHARVLHTLFALPEEPDATHD